MSEISQLSYPDPEPAPVTHLPHPGPFQKDFSELDKFFRMYGKYAFRVARQSLPDNSVAEEIVHDAFLKYWNGNISSFQPLTSVTFFGWLIREVQSSCQKRLLEHLPRNVFQADNTSS